MTENSTAPAGNVDETMLPCATLPAADPSPRPIVIDIETTTDVNMAPTGNCSPLDLTFQEEPLDLSIPSKYSCNCSDQYTL